MLSEREDGKAGTNFTGAIIERADGPCFLEQFHDRLR